VARLPRAVRVLQSGLVLNAFGNGMANPFVVLYLYNVRGIALPVAGLVAAANAVAAMLAALIGGAIADRRGAVPTMLAGLGCSALAFTLYPLVHAAWSAFAVAILAGAGGGVWLTLQSSVLAAITPAPLRTAAFARQRVIANVGLGLGGFVGGLIANATRPASFTVLFGLNAISFAAYGIVASRIRTAPPPTRAAMTAGYRLVLADPALVRVAGLNLIAVVGAVSLLNSVVPVYARNQVHVSEAVIGLLFLLNSVTVIVAQVPIARIVQGRRRMRAWSVMGGLFAACWWQVGAARWLPAPLAVTALVSGILALSLAECVYDSVQGPLIADLAPEGRLARYMAVMGFAWQLGFVIGPALGTSLLAAAPRVTWPVFAVICTSGALLARVAERHLPASARRAPLPVG
jgi:MFS family permease